MTTEDLPKIENIGSYVRIETSKGFYQLNRYFPLISVTKCGSSVNPALTVRQTGTDNQPNELVIQCGYDAERRRLYDWLKTNW